MLEFIVLGRIPGTGVQITFWWYLVIVLFALVLLETKLHEIHKDETEHNNLNLIAVFSRSGQVKYFVHTIEVLREQIVLAWKLYLLKIIQLLF